jgi:3-hydroxy-3-methylglutaryl CoA synthase
MVISHTTHRTFISQKTLEKSDGVSSGKYIKGLEQEGMAFVGDREDIVSTFLTATAGLLRKVLFEKEKKNFRFIFFFLKIVQN